MEHTCGQIGLMRLQNTANASWYSAWNFSVHTEQNTGRQRASPLIGSKLTVLPARVEHSVCISVRKHAHGEYLGANGGMLGTGRPDELGHVALGTRAQVAQIAASQAQRACVQL